ncbi:MAG: AMP-binding protein [Clostridia bacterium]|nr:AMP-binding protein [Clostridia bacterium]
MKTYKLYKSEHIHDLREMLQKNAKVYATKPLFLRKVNGEYLPTTYAEFYADVKSFGGALVRRGLAGKRIIVTGENCYAWCVAYMTAVCGLGIVIPVDKEIPAEELANIAKISGASAIVYSAKYEQKVAGVGKRLQKYTFDNVLEICKSPDACSKEDIEAYENRSIDIDEMAVLLFTSGTTGVSKGVMLSQRNLCCNIHNLAKLVNIGSDDLALSVLPLHHVYECTAGFLYPMSRGAAIAHSEGVRYIMKNMKEVHPTKMICVPLLLETMYNKMWANIRKKGIENKVHTIIKATNALKPESVRMAAKRKVFAEIHESLGGRLNLLVSGGAPVDPRVLRGLRDFGFNVIQGYGLTECGPLAAVNPDSAPKDRSAGVALPGGELKIIDADSEGIGEICYRGDNVMLGYYKMPEETAQIKKNGWLHTGDLGYIDEDGYLIITGRKKNVIVTANGKNIFPEELETYLMRNNYISECVVVGYMNEKKKDYDIVALIYPDYNYAKETLGTGATEAAIYDKITAAVDEVNATVQTYKRINITIMRNEEFPKNSSRKIKRVGVADLAREEYLAKRG